jgi:hypothetical protein
MGQMPGLGKGLPPLSTVLREAVRRSREIWRIYENQNALKTTQSVFDVTLVIHK